MKAIDRQFLPYKKKKTKKKTYDYNSIKYSCELFILE